MSVSAFNHGMCGGLSLLVLCELNSCMGELNGNFLMIRNTI